jgi:NADH dehydrogenase
VIAVTGASGFVGRSIVARLVEAGEQVRALSRHPQPVPGAESIAADVTTPDTLAAAFAGCDAVIHLVGIIREVRGRSFEQVHVEGTRNVLAACREAGIGRLLHMSALGARPGAASRYHRTKWEAEELVRQSGLDATIFRPSIIYGKGSVFLATLRGLVRHFPLIPVIGDGTALLQPIWNVDVAACFLGALQQPETIGQTYELGGPEAFGFEQLLDLVADAEGLEKHKLHLPLWLMRPAAAVLGRLLLWFPITSDQLVMLLEDNVCDIAPMVTTFGFRPASVREHLKESQS